MKLSQENVRGRKIAVIAAAAVAAVIAAVVLVRSLTGGDNSSKFRSLIDTGNRYLEELDYEQAVVVFDAAIALEPKKAEGYVGKATAQYRLVWSDEAAQTVSSGLDEGSETAGSSGFAETLNSLSEALETVSSGLEQAEDDTSELAALQDLILNAIEEVIQESAAETGGGAAEQTAERAGLADLYGLTVTSDEAQTLFLNYSLIEVEANTGDYEFQLEVLGADEDETFDWSIKEVNNSSGEDFEEQVTQDGLLTFSSASEHAAEESQSVRFDVIARNDWGESVSCAVWIFTDDLAVDLPCYEICGTAEDEDGEEQIYRIEVTDESVAVANLADYIYYSGRVTIPEQLTVQGTAYEITDVDNWLLHWMTDVESIEIPAGVTGIGDLQEKYGFDSNPFTYCSSLTEIIVDEDNETFRSIDGVLYSKDGKTLYCYPCAKEGESFTLPKEVKAIAEDAFVGCSNLKEILVEDGSSCYVSDDGVLINTETHTLEAYPAGKEDAEYAIPEDVEEIGTYAFHGSQVRSLYTGGVSTLRLRAGSCPDLQTVIAGDALEELIILPSGLNVQLESAAGLVQLWITVESAEDLSWMAEMTELEELTLNIEDYTEIDWDSLAAMPSLKSLILRYLYEKDDGLPSYVETVRAEAQEHAGELEGCSISVIGTLYDD